MSSPTPAIPSYPPLPSQTHLHIPVTYSLFDAGIFRDTLLPNLSLHSSFSLVAYGLSRYTDRVEAKDWLWPTAFVANAWWSAVGRRVIEYDLPLSRAVGVLSRPEKLLLGGVTVWGARLLYRVVSRSIERGTDDPRYAALKKEPGFWNAALWKVFAPEAAIQALISLPFTLPFRHQGAVLTGYHPLIQALAVGLFTSGFALEVLADGQLAAHQKSESERGSETVLTEGVWSLSRHPNYLGDTLIHASFPLLLYGSDMLHPAALLGPVVNYIFLRYLGGDAQTESSQEERYAGEKGEEFEGYRKQKNAVWPGVKEVGNPWLWGVVGAGVVGVLAEGLVDGLFARS